MLIEPKLAIVGRGRALSKGQISDVPDDYGREMISKGYAIPVHHVQYETARLEMDAEERSEVEHG